MPPRLIVPRRTFGIKDGEHPPFQMRRPRPSPGPRTNADAAIGNDPARPIQEMVGVVGRPGPGEQHHVVAGVLAIDAQADATRSRRAG